MLRSVERDGPRLALLRRGAGGHEGLEYVAALLEAGELIERGAGGREHHHVPRLGRGQSRVEGQIRGIRGMVERSAYCPDILAQVAAANAALNAFGKELLAEHIRTCVAQDIRTGKDETIDELVATLQKLMR